MFRCSALSYIQQSHYVSMGLLNMWPGGITGPFSRTFEYLRKQTFLSININYYKLTIYILLFNKYLFVYNSKSLDICKLLSIFIISSVFHIFFHHINKELLQSTEHCNIHNCHCIGHR